MNSLEIQKVEDYIREKWPASPEPRIALFQSILSECAEDKHPSITVGQIRKHTDLDVKEILNFMSYLCSDQIFLFDAQFHIYDAGKFHPVTTEYVCEAMDQGFIEVPETGVKYDDVMQRVTMYYEPTSALNPLLVSGANHRQGTVTV